MRGKELGLWGHTDRNALEAFLEAVPWREHRVLESKVDTPTLEFWLGHSLGIDLNVGAQPL